jgi:hypothetical protein
MAEAYIDEFQRLAVMVQDMSPTRLMMLFTEGLMEPLKGWVKAFKPTSLQEAIRKTRELLNQNSYPDHLLTVVEEIKGLQ